MTNPSATPSVWYSDVVSQGEYFAPGPHHGFYCAHSAAPLVAAIELGEIHGPDGEPCNAIHYATGDDSSEMIWRA